jgi:hypothetical protein
MACLLGLTGASLKGRLTDLTDTESCGESRDSGSNSLSENPEGNPGLKQEHQWCHNSKILIIN